MLKATAKLPDGRTLLILGLSEKNIEHIEADPAENFVRVDGKRLGDLPVDVLVFYGKTEADMTEKLKSLIGPDTKVHIDPKLRS